jgi:tryptophanyl-tRNA synthetase
MAADILIYDSDVVPVGADQIQHLEVTRDIAQRFNSMFGETLVLPKPHVLDASAKVPGVDGEKMSKSYNNTIPIFDTPKRLKKMINRIKTDSATVEDPKNPDACAIFDLYRLFATEQQQQDLAGRYRAGGMGYGEAKAQLHEAAMNYFQPAFDRRAELEKRPDEVEDILRQGARKASEKAGEVLDRARAACGLTARFTH